MVLLQSLVFPLLALQPLVSANELVERKIDCSNPKVKSLVKSAKSVAGKQIKTFCSSYLHYKTKTKTVVETFTWTNVVDEFVTEGIDTFLTFTTTTISATTTVIRTLGVYEGVEKRDVAASAAPALNPTAASSQITQAPAYDDAEADPEDLRRDIQERALPKKLKPDYRGRVLGSSPRIVSEACSCLVKKPTLTTTTSYFAIEETATATYTVASDSTWTTVCLLLSSPLPLSYLIPRLSILTRLSIIVHIHES